MKFKTKQKNRFLTSIFVCAVLMVSAFFGVLVSLAIFSDSKTMSTDLNFSAAILDGTSTKSYSSTINFTLINQQIFGENVTFAKASNSTNLYVRASLKFSTTSSSVVAKDIIKYQPITLSTPPSGYAWVQWGEYYYLMDSTNTGNLKALTDSTIFTLFNKESIIIPPEVVGNYSATAPINCSITIEAIQSSAVATATIEGTKTSFSNTPTTTHTITVKNSSGTILSTYSQKAYGSTITLNSGDVLSSEAGKTFSLNTKADGTGSTINYRTEGSINYIDNISQDLTLYQVQKTKEFTITTSKTGNGVVSPSFTTVNYGDEVSLTITPAEGYKISSITDNGTNVMSLFTNNTYTISNAQQNHEINVVFKEIMVVLNINGGTGTQPQISFTNNDTNITISTSDAPTMTKKVFYFYSTNSADTQYSPTGTIYIPGTTYATPATATTLYAIYCTQPSTFYMSFALNANGNYSVDHRTSTSGSGSPQSVIIPNYYNDQTNGTKIVTEILTGAFPSLSYVASMFIPNTITTINADAFTGCTAMLKIYVNSQTVANMLTSQTACGNLINYAVAGTSNGQIYLANNITPSSYLNSAEFTKTTNAITYSGITFNLFVKN